MKKLVDGVKNPCFLYGVLYIKIKGTFDAQIISFFVKYMSKRNG